METTQTAHQPAKQSTATAAFVCGIIACAFNLLFITAIIGVILGILAIIFGAVTYKNHRKGKTGLLLGLLSFSVVFAYLFSIVAITWVDPFL